MKRLLLRVIAPGVALLAVLLWQIGEAQRRHDVQVTEAATARLAERIDAEFAILAHELNLFAHLPSVQDGDRDRMTRDAAQLSLHLRGWLALVENGGDQHASFSPEGDAGAGDASPPATRSADFNRVVVSDIHPEFDLELPVFSLSKRLNHATFTDHSLVLTVAVSRLAQKLTDLDLPPAGVAAIVDGSGQVIAGNADVPIPQLTAIPNGLAQALASGPQGSTTRDLDGFGSPQSVTGWQGLTNAPGWVVVVSLPEGQPGAAYGSLALPAALVLLTLLLLVGRHSLMARLERHKPVQAVAQGDESPLLAQDVAILRREAARQDEQKSMLLHDMRAALLGTQELIQRLSVTNRDPAQTFYLGSALAAIRRTLRMIEDSEAILPNSFADNLAETVADNLAGPTLANGSGLPRTIVSRMPALRDSLSRLEPFAPHSLLASLPPLVEGQAQRNGTVLTVDLARDMPWLLGDPTQIGQIVLNLLGNAAKFTRKGVVSLAARVEPLGDRPQRACLIITVTDTGPGIAPDELDQIFAPRFRGAQRGDHEIEGSGLGLCIVKRLVDAMQGSIAVKSAVGQGSTFTLTLPLDLVRPVARPEPGTAPDLLMGRRVLLVDDDPTMLLAGSKALQRAGAQVRLANTAADALAACRDASPDAFVLDLNMPGIDVAELVRAIRRMPKLQGRPIIAFSGKMDAQRVAECRAMGFDAAIQKDADLSQAVSDVLAAA